MEVGVIGLNQTIQIYPDTSAVSQNENISLKVPGFPTFCQHGSEDYGEKIKSHRARSMPTFFFTSTLVKHLENNSLQQPHPMWVHLIGAAAASCVTDSTLSTTPSDRPGVWFLVSVMKAVSTPGR